ncbi:protein FAR1-RELATED SEQUENCE 3 isoform X1 [Sesamum indicum]|uniref:Protein FAR1-RELATED SEQUENCE n=1 Tax=Sesamum indicum TaxID=4182 RepID=A0A6I9T4I5_SESIN|nr:protein FAR1-RELATED SEQUENCE 3 isoform X1 [Sesamum indicum]XP_011078718.1 protein FAR1-RELATED SEQUENCE 3 isoform X1 [Sesamum indicum]XP_011078719.1 protein FAR1-RELATED SEQUENCE 3 isoform X1 [Sesamum indicum]XP_011078720.1 protein FAR1-RELATED SEQUENCE 3 isoform X1 [Sesamum indicum]XP_011078721.1 protein FAR1-RELATED SEQUENCE 3 isoform X1 [Sesamum indicum]XP_011078722.1 protein FAR1-RELATED SEQUENCE 3 isoform X1 [Sesamum indicum]XP_020549440.1 protein FAR1-RELATED SEQUENCE 3 isoform X1 [
MDAEVIEVDMGRRQRNRASYTHCSEDGEENLTENSSVGGMSNEVDDRSEKPYVGMEFESEEAAKNLYDAYARRVGFSTHVGQYIRTKPDGPIVSWEFACSREVFKRKNVESCNAMLRIDRKDPDIWVVTKFVEDHNHSTVSPSKVHYLRPRRHFAGTTKSVPETADNQNDIMVSVDGNHVFYDPIPVVGDTSPIEINRTVRNASPAEKIPVVRNLSSFETNRATTNTIPLMPVQFIQPSSRRRTLGRDAQNLLTYFRKMQAENPGFYYAIQLDDENRLSNVFWADARSRIAYSHFGDAVVFDTMYRPNQFQVPFAPFTGVNNHGQMVLFGCALLLDESEASFAWVFKTWLSAMNDQPPVSITTDQDRAIKAAVHQVFPETRHCICKWHILREGQERLSHIYLAHPSFYGELYSCINFSETIEDFESSWSSVLDKYDLWKNEWLQAVYNARKQWAPVYFRDTFFAALSSNHGVSSFFDGYVNQQTTIPMFFKQYERALENSLENEIEADYDTMCTTPVLKTPSPMEQQAANLYTRKVFAKFQEELVETFVYTANKIDGDGTVSKFRVAKYEHDHKAYIVMLDVSGMNASCSCQMFEYSGVLCRHILTVFTVTNVLTIPSHYILKRWTRNARASLSDEQEIDMQCMESLTVRFNNLCREALKFAEVGAVAAETYNAAMDVLQEGARKISMVKKNVTKIKSPSSQGSGSFQDNGSKKASVSIPDTVPSLWPWQDAAQNRFNINDAGPPVADLNHPTMAPIAINRDGSLADNSVVLTCFKSMTWVIENKNSASKVAVINLKLHDYGKTPSGETEVQFRLTRVTLEPMLKSMAYISQQLSTPANRVAVINLKLQDTKTTSGEAEVKFQVSRDTLASMLRSMAYIREQL